MFFVLSSIFYCYAANTSSYVKIYLAINLFLNLMTELYHLHTNYLINMLILKQLCWFLFSEELNNCRARIHRDSQVKIL